MKEAYRGYLVCTNVVGDCWVEKDTSLICWVTNAKEGKRQVDALLDGSEKRDRVAGGER